MEEIIEYKSYVTPISDLLGALVPEIQRDLDTTQCDALYDMECRFYTLHGKYLTPGKISIALVSSAPTKYIMDGQHRLHVYQRLIKEFPDRVLLIAVDEYTVKATTSLELLYKFVNTCRPNAITKLSIDEYKITRELSAWLTTHWPKYLKPSTKPRAPNLSLATIADLMHKRRIVARGEFTCGRMVIDRLIALNSHYLSISAGAARKQTLDRWGVAIPVGANGLLIGYWKGYEWLDRLCDPDPAAVEHYSATVRVVIPTCIRLKVWAGDSIHGVCYCCNDPITITNFQCGHIVPLCYGGKTVVANLRAICGQCNRNMRTMNLLDYKKIIQDQS